MDNLTKSQRSKCMSNIRSKWTAQEQLIHKKLKKSGIDHKMHPQLAGNPDLILSKKKRVVFMHGCFWHKCTKCFQEPKSRRKYWLPKLEKNVKRDLKNRRLLRSQGYSVYTVWEHDIKKNLDSVFKRITK